LLKKIIYLLQNKDICDKIRENGYKTVQKYTWNKIAPQIAKIAIEKSY